MFYILFTYEIYTIEHRSNLYRTSINIILKIYQTSTEFLLEMSRGYILIMYRMLIDPHPTPLGNVIWGGGRAGCCYRWCQHWIFSPTCWILAEHLDLFFNTCWILAEHLDLVIIWIFSSAHVGSCQSHCIGIGSFIVATIGLKRSFRIWYISSGCLFFNAALRG